MKTLILVLIVGIGMFSCKKLDTTRELPSETSKAESKLFAEPKTRKFKENELMVKFKDNTNQKSLSSVKGRVKEHLQTKMMERKGDKGFDLINVDNVESAFEILKNDPNVEMVSPNYIRTISQVQYPNDPLLPSMWGMGNIQAQTAWSAGAKGDTSVIVGLSDEGIKYWHQDLKCAIWTNPFDPVDGIDNDGNGYIDDIHGWDWFNNNNTIFDNNDPHGTHTAGTIGATGNDGIGLSGVCPQVTIISLKFLEGYGDDFGAIRGYDYLADLKVRHNLNIVATSNSWGGGGFNPFLYAALQRQGAQNIAAICAAGNSRTDNDNDPDPNYPSTYDLDNIISVAALQWDNTLAYFSSYGANSVDLAAPGVGILSTVPGNLYQINSYQEYSGTSMATPMVAGAYALYAASHPEASVAQIKAAILNSVTTHPSLTGKVKTGGTLNISTFTQSTPTQQEVNCLSAPDDLDDVPPTMPTDLQVVNVDIGQVTLKWRKGADNNPGALTYIITNVGFWIEGTSDTVHTMTGLQPGTYDFFVQARDLWGNGSNPTITVTATVPGDDIPPTPPFIDYTSISETSITHVFLVGSDNIGVSHYKVYWRKVGDPSWNTFNQTRVTYVFTINGLTPSTTYEVYMTTIDYTGNESVPSNRIVSTTNGTPTDPLPDTQAPTNPTNLSVINPTLNSLTLNWTASTDNVGVAGYDIYRNGTKVGESPTNSYLDIGLSSGTTYNYFVRARDAVPNFSGNSSTASGTTLTPEQPVCTISSELNAASQSLNVTLSWTINSTCPVQSTRLERKKGSNGTYSVVAFDPTSPYQDNVPTPGQYTYRLRVMADGQTVFSNEKIIQVKKK